MSRKKQETQGRNDLAIELDVWGCRGSRNLPHGSSVLGTNTSCYSIRRGDDLCVLDAGRGLIDLTHALQTQERFRDVRRVHVLVSHSHLDHWEGIKDAEWFWRPHNGFEISIYGTNEALGAIRRGYDPPAFVAPEILSIGTIESLRFVPIESDGELRSDWFTLRTQPLHHFSGTGEHIRMIDAAGFRLTVKDGPTIAYLCDHQPAAHTRKIEDDLIDGAAVAFVDSHFGSIAQQAFGHGSQEYAARLARDHVSTLVLATHHGASRTDDDLLAAQRRYGADLGNFDLARESDGYRWNPATGRLEPTRKSGR